MRYCSMWCDYVDSCSVPSAFLKSVQSLREHCVRETNAEIIARALRLIQIRASGAYTNGFTAELWETAEANALKYC